MPKSKVPLHGGGAAKVSGFYESHWTAFTLIDILIGRATSITLEPPGTAGYGFEFLIEKPWGREWHQVKYQNSKAGKWTLLGLQDENVLTYFREKLISDAENSCTFVSAHATHPLGRLRDSAAESTSIQQFESVFLSSKLLIDSFRELYDVHWTIDRVTAWEWLRQRIHLKTIDAGTLESLLAERAETYFNEAAHVVTAALDQILTEILYRSHSADTLTPRLAELGATLRDISQPSVALENIRAKFVGGAEIAWVNKEYIDRPAVTSICSFIRRSSFDTILVTGKAGCGKTTVLAQVVRALIDDGVNVLPIDLMNLSNESSALEVGESLGLTSSPIRKAVRAAGANNLVVVIDAVDSLAASRGKSPALYGAVAEVLRECRSYPNIQLIISCRTQDLETDLRVKSLLGPPSTSTQIEVDVLDLSTTRRAVSESGHNPEALTESEIEILRTPANLKMFALIPQSRLRPFATNEELIEIYIEWAVAP